MRTLLDRVVCKGVLATKLVVKKPRYSFCMAGTQDFFRSCGFARSTCQM